MKKLILASACSIALATQVMAQTPKGTIYLTFDDGPMNATPALIDVLNQGDIKATFYFNAWHLDGIGGENEDQALPALIKALETGHVVANHSYDHMVHNCVDENGDNSAQACNATGNHQIHAYQDAIYDASMFDKNLTVLESYIPNINSYPNYKGKSLARLPYTNSWRVSSELKSDGLCATTDELKPWEPGYVCDPENPSNSSTAGIEVSNILANKEMIIHGWDVDWAPENWGIPMPANSLTEADVMLTYIDQALNACAPTTIEPVNSKSQNFPCANDLHKDKVVLLAHDFLFEDGRRGQGATKNLPKLAKFIQLAKQAGYQFDTMDNYAPQWQEGVIYNKGDYVTYMDRIYNATVAHTSQITWQPSLESNIWVSNMASQVWIANKHYKAGQTVFYMGQAYEVLTDHRSQADWNPKTSDTLFVMQ